MKPSALRKAFTLVEMLLVIAIISVLAAMAISNFANASQDTREIITRQQLAVVQEALSQYVNKEIGRIPPLGAKPNSISDVMSTYNGATGKARYDLFASYLDDATRDNLDFNTGTGRITSQAMRDTNHYLTLPDWSSSSFPKAEYH